MKKLVYLLSLSLLFACPSDDLDESEPTVQPVTYLLLNFTFTQQTEINEDALFYQIEYVNPNNFAVTGTPRVTTTIGGGSDTVTYIPNDQCQMIEANSSCVLTYDVVDDNPLLFPAEPIEFVSAEYILD